MAAQLARRERRGSQKSFVVAGLAMALAVSILATVLNVTDSLRTSFSQDAKTILGGDLELELVTRGFADEELEWMRENASGTSVAKTTRALALTDANQQLVYFKSVDEAYPLLGEMVLEDGEYSLDMLEEKRGEAHPALVSRDLVGLLDVGLGDTFSIGSATLYVAAFIAKEPDPNTRVWVIAPPVVVSEEAFAASNLEVPGAIVRRKARILLPQGVSEEGFGELLKENFPNANWEIENQEDVLDDFSEVLNQLETFLTLASLGTILIAGIGIGNTVTTFLSSRIATIATLKSLGGTSELIRMLYLLQICVICIIGAGIGAAAGTAISSAIIPIISSYLPLELEPIYRIETLFNSVAYALMSALVFSLPPLYRFSLTSPTLLFSPVSVAAAYEPAAIPPEGRIWPAAIAAALLALLYYTSSDTRIFYWTVAGGVLAFVLFTALGHALSRLAAHVTAGPLPVRFAFRTISRNPTQMRIGMVSFGVALAALTSLLLTQSNLDNQLGDGLREKSPNFYIIGIQPYQKDDLLAASSAVESATKMVLLPFIRGRITKLAGVPVEEIEPPEEYDWVLENDRGITWLDKADEGGIITTAKELVTEEWIASGPGGDGLEVSFDGGAARAYGLEIGDTISFVVEEEELTATITELRPIDWRDLQINFVMVFSHSEWEDVPAGYLGGIHMDAADENAYQRTVALDFPNVTLISTGAIFATAQRLIGNVNAIINAVTLVAVLTGLLVIATTVIQGQQARTIQTVVMRVLGARHSSLTSIFCVEFLVMAVLATFPAMLLGGLSAHLVVTRLFRLDWGMDYPSAFMIAGSMILISVLGGLASLIASLRHPPLKFLRNE